MTSEVIVTMDLTLTPEAGPHFARLDPSGLEGTRNFPGCRAVQIVMHKDDANRFMFIERWESEDAYRSYIAWRTESGEFQALEAMATSIKVDIWPQTIVAV
jgi:quinol monooxygenase YgiN